MKEKLLAAVDGCSDRIASMADFIFDHPETAFRETRASGLLADFLEGEGFAVERGLGSLPTAFRAVWERGSGGPVLGLLCEYDALEMGHACAHHLQGPAVAAAAKAVKDVDGPPVRLVVYGTPAEEGGGGKIRMLEEGYLAELEAALMMHGGSATQTDVKSLAAATLHLEFRGRSSHAALKPEAGRSALDALLLAFNAVEFLREHVPEDARMHYTVLDAGGPANVVPARAAGEFSLRSYNSFTLDNLVARLDKIARGAALMTETEHVLTLKKRLEAKIPVESLNRILMENAVLVDAPARKPPRERTGSSDFGNVQHRVPGACIRVAFVDEGISSHSEGFLAEGKTERGHRAAVLGAKILAASVWDLLTRPGALEEVRREFLERKERMAAEAG